MKTVQNYLLIKVLSTGKYEVYQPVDYDEDSEILEQAIGKSVLLRDGVIRRYVFKEQQDPTFSDLNLEETKL